MFSASIYKVIICSICLLTTAELAEAHPLKAPQQNIQIGYAAAGFDVVSYFEAGEPEQGSDEFTLTHNGVKYRFASAANMQKYLSNPARYRPQYGGYCALGLTVGRKFPVDPSIYKLVDDRLYFYRNYRFRDKWTKNAHRNIELANHNWELVRHIDDAALAKNTPEGVKKARP